MKFRAQINQLHSLSIRPSYGARGEEILDGGGGRGRRSFFPSPLFVFRFHFSPFPQKRLILRLSAPGTPGRICLTRPGKAGTSKVETKIMAERKLASQTLQRFTELEELAEEIMEEKHQVKHIL